MKTMKTMRKIMLVAAAVLTVTIGILCSGCIKIEKSTNAISEWDKEYNSDYDTITYTNYEKGIVLAERGNELVMVDYNGSESEVTIPANCEGKAVTKIGKEAFVGSKVQAVVIPVTVKAIESSAFYGCNELENVYLPDGLVEIGYAAFSNCTALKEITIPASVEIIRGKAFFHCTALDTVRFSPNSNLGTIQDYAFLEIGDEVTEVTLPAMVYSVGTSIFAETVTIIK